MIQKKMQQRMYRLGILGIGVLVVIFSLIVLREYRKRPAPPPPPFPKEPPTVALLITANREGKLEVCG